MFKTPLTHPHVLSLISTFGAKMRHLDNGLGSYLAWIDQKKINEPERDAFLGECRLYGSVFSQIEQGGHRMISPDGRPVRALVLFSEKEPVINQDGEFTRVYMFCPQLGMGDITVALKNETECFIEIGLSFSEGGTMMELFESIWKVDSKEKEMA